MAAARRTPTAPPGIGVSFPSATARPRGNACRPRRTDRGATPLSRTADATGEASGDCAGPRTPSDRRQAQTRLRPASTLTRAPTTSRPPRAGASLMRLRTWDDSQAGHQRAPFHADPRIRVRHDAAHCACRFSRATGRRRSGTQPAERARMRRSLSRSVSSARCRSSSRMRGAAVPGRARLARTGSADGGNRGRRCSERRAYRHAPAATTAAPVFFSESSSQSQTSVPCCADKVCRLRAV